MHPLADHSQGENRHLSDGVMLADVGPARELVDLPVEMLDRHLVVSAHIAAL